MSRDNIYWLLWLMKPLEWMFPSNKVMRLRYEEDV
jgi:hypothetical protein